MSKILRIQEGGYKLITEPGSEILLDTGPASGQVRITGDLIVEGDTTELEVANVVVEDNILVINRGGGDSLGIKPSLNGKAGILIERGSAPPSYFIWDESIDHFKPGDSGLTRGSFVFTSGSDAINNSNLVGITTNVVQNPFSSLHFNLGESGVLSVNTDGPEPYHERIGANEDIPNVKYIKEYVRAEAGAAVIEQFFRYLTTESGTFINTETGARAQDVLSGDALNGVVFSVGTGSQNSRVNNKVGLMGANGLIVGNPLGSSNERLKLFVQNNFSAFDDFEVGIATDNADLTIQPETGIIKLKKIIHMTHLTVDDVEPTPIVENSIIYTKTDQGAGGTGIYFHSPTKDGFGNDVFTSGELCSAAKALVYGLIF